MFVWRMIGREIYQNCSVLHLQVLLLLLFYDHYTEEPALVAVSALTLLVGRQEGQACNKLGMVEVGTG